MRLDYNLWQTKPAGRWYNDTQYQETALKSPLAVQGSSGQLRLGKVKLLTQGQPVWLIVQDLIPEQRTWIAVNPQNRPTYLKSETPCGILTATQWGMGRIEWRSPVGSQQQIIIEGLEPPSGLQVPEGIQISYRLIDSGTTDS